MPLKKKNITRGFIIIFCCLIVIGCKKQPKDYRTKFIGDYTFIVDKRYHSGWPTVVYSDSVYFYKGKVEYGSNEQSVLISFSDGVFIEPKIYEDGTFDYYYGFKTEGEFETTRKVKFEYGWAHPGYGVDYYVTGEKKP